MKRIRVIISVICLVISNTLISQNEADVLRYTDTDFFGSARLEGMAGSFGALGADFSSVQINPAGLGRFSSSQLNFSLNNVNERVTGTYHGEETFESNNALKVGSAGLVITQDVSAHSEGSIYRQISFGYTHLRNFDRVRRYQGQNFNSLLDGFAAEGQGIPYVSDPFDPNFSNGIFVQRPFSTALGLDANTISHVGNQTYQPNLVDEDVIHDRTVTTEGGMGEYHIALTDNYQNKLYWGGSLGFRRVKYEESILHNERMIETGNYSLLSFDYLFNLNVEGWGYNLKLGAIYLPQDEFRLGLAFESPTIINLEETFSADMVGYHGDETYVASDIEERRGSYGYRIRTPMKIRASMAYIFDYRGAINIDAEFVDYGRGRISQPNPATWGSYDFDFENETVDLFYRPVINLRIGGEYKLTETFFIRGGYAFLPQPFDNDIVNLSSFNQTFALGAGYEKGNLNVDIGYRFFNYNEDYYGFNPSDIDNLALFETWSNTLSASVKLRF